MRRPRGAKGSLNQGSESPQERRSVFIKAFLISLDEVQRRAEDRQLHARRGILNVDVGRDEKSIQAPDQIRIRIRQVTRPVFHHLEEERREKHAHLLVLVVVEAGLKDFFQSVRLVILEKVK